MRSTAPLFVLVLTVATFAGCLGQDDLLPPPASTGGPLFDGTFTWAAPLLYDAQGSPLTDHPLLPDAVRPRYIEQLVPSQGAEPNIGVTKSGALFVTTFDQVQRSRDQGRTWEVVHDFVSPNQPITEDQWSTSDPMLWVDPITDRIYVNHMYPPIVCTYVAWSDDEGDTWTERPYACGTPYLDHQKIMTAPHGPNAAPIGLAASTAGLYPNAVYLCVNKIELGTWCAVSHDGGYTWPYDNQLAPLDKLCGAINGHPAAYPDGSVVVAFGGFGGGDRCNRPMTVAVTEDDGITWTTRQCAPEFGQAEIDPDITVTPDGTAYLLFRDTRDQIAYLARSTDKFQTCDVFRAAPADHTMNVFTVIASGDDGRIAMAYLGTRDEQEKGAIPSDARQGSVWHLYLTTSHDADAENPTFITQQVTPEEDPVQVGCIWLSGGGGGPYRCRNLLDFIDMTRDSEGRAYVAFTDGCVPRNGCAGTPIIAAYQSRDRQIAVAVQDSGMSLFESVGVLPALGLEPPRPLSDAPDDAK